MKKKTFLREKKKMTFKRKLQLTLRMLPYGLIIGIGLGIHLFGLPTEKVIVEKEIIKTETGAVLQGKSLEEKVEELKQEVLNDLTKAEVAGYEHMDAIIVFDPLKKDLASCQRVGGVRLHCYSFGVYNFKIGTVQYYYEKFYGYTPSDKEALDIALDNNKARELAYKIIFDEVGGIWNWTNSAKKIAAAERIEFIRSLEQ